MNLWLLLGLAIVAEVIGSASLRASEGFTRWLPSVLVVLGYAATFSLMAQILKTLPLSLTYTDSVQFPHSRDNTACASMPRSPYFFLLPLVGLNPQTTWDLIGIRITPSGRAWAPR